MTITESQSRKILVNLESGQNPINQRDYDKLVDFESLQSYSQKELQQKSIELQNALKSFKKLQEQITGEKSDMDLGDYDDDYGDENGFDNETPSNVNFFGLIPRGIKAIFNVFNNYLSLFLVFVLIYVALLMLRKINDSEKKMKKKKQARKKREEEEYEEEEVEYEKEYDLNTKKGKKFKKK